jgi:PucR family transcriptional regulator, purine catabolism regulatory protein
MIKLRDLLAVRRLDLRVRACETGIDAWVRWAHVVEDLGDVARLSGGELILTNGRWRRSPADADRFACALVQRGVGALGVSSAMSAHGIDELAAACEHWRLPLVAIGAHSSCEEVAEAAITAILDRRSAGVLRSVERTRAFTDALHRPTGAPAILGVLGHDLDRRVWLLTRAAAFVAPGAEPPADDEVRAVAEALASGVSPAEIRLEDGAAATTFPVASRHGRPQPAAHLVCAGAPEELDAEDRLAIDQALMFLSVDRDTARSRRSARRASIDEFMRRATSGEATAEELEAWARGLGVEPRGHVACVVVHVPGATGEQAADITSGLEDMADAHGVPCVAVSGDQEASAFLFPGGIDNGIEQAVARAEAALAPELRRLGGSVGTSSVMAKDVADVLRTLHDARRVCQLNLLREPDPRVEARGPEPPLSTLLLMGNEEARAALYSTLLEPLVAYDGEHGSELVRTLDVFLSTCGQWSSSAAELGVHVNTLRYRLARIEKCTGRDLGSMADRVDFYVALRAEDARIDARGRAAPVSGAAQPR